MTITSRGRYALRVMLDLAQHAEEGHISLKTVSERQEVSMKYLEAIVADLRKAGLVESTRGKDGGYCLTRDPEGYTVLEILRCIEENLSSVACATMKGSGACERAASCMSLPMWRELDEITNEYFAGVTLRDLMTGERWKTHEE